MAVKMVQRRTESKLIHKQLESNKLNDKPLTHSTLCIIQNFQCKMSHVFAGKKLKCPFCERLYGYETNLRAHVRQRHQGIRVSCPFCSRTFTRNNTVRRHIAREHKNEMSIKAFQTSTHQVADTVPQ